MFVMLTFTVTQRKLFLQLKTLMGTTAGQAEERAMSGVSTGRYQRCCTGTHTLLEHTRALPLPDKEEPGYAVAFRAGSLPPGTPANLLPGVHQPPVLGGNAGWDLQVDLSTSAGLSISNFWKLWGVCGKCEHIIYAPAWEKHISSVDCAAFWRGKMNGGLSHSGGLDFY